MKKSLIYNWWLSGNAGAPDPTALFGNDLGLWISRRSTSTKTRSGIYNSQLDSLVTDDQNAVTFTKSSAPSTPKFGGNFFYTQGSAGIETTEKTLYKFLHGPNSFYFACEIMFTQAPVTTASGLYPIFNNNGGTTAKTGFNLQYDNRAASSVSNALRVTVTFSSAGNSVINLTVNNAITPTIDLWQKIEVIRLNNNVGLWLNGVLIGNQNNVNTPSTADPTDGLSIFKSSGAATYATGLCLGHIVAVKRTITTDERTALNTYFAEGNKTAGTGQILYFGFGGSQSNFVGTPTGPPAELQTEQDFYILNVVNSLSEYAKLDFGVNQQSVSLTTFGPNLSFGNQMQQRQAGKVFMYQVSDSGTSMYSSWDVVGNPSGTGGTFISRLNSTNNKTLKYAINGTVKVRFFIWRQGEADSSVSNPNNGNAAAITADYKTKFTELYKQFLDSCFNAGFDTSECKLIVSLMAYAGNLASYPNYLAVNAALVDVAENFRSDNPSYASKCADGEWFTTDDLTYSDGTHFDANSQVIQGERFANLVIL